MYSGLVTEAGSSPELEEEQSLYGTATFYLFKPMEMFAFHRQNLSVLLYLHSVRQLWLFDLCNLC